MLIVGAGLSGLIAAHAFPEAELIEASPEPTESHKALLRFRSDVVSRLTHIPFKKVKVHKGIFFQRRYVPPSIEVANLYAMKTLGCIKGDRSIWDVAPVERWIAPDDFYDRLIYRLRQRISFGAPFDFKSAGSTGEPVISTAPLNLVLKSLAIEPEEELVRAPIKVVRAKFRHVAGIYQTIYFPGPETPVYRASITGSTLIVECVEGHNKPLNNLDGVVKAFGLNRDDYDITEAVKQRYGKIADIDPNYRRKLIYQLTEHHKILSLGRFAVWRNLLLDDVVRDTEVIKEIMAQDSYYTKLKSTKVTI